MISLYKAIALAFGYAENNTTSYLIYHSDFGCSTRKEALSTLVVYLWDKYNKQTKEGLEFGNGYSNNNKCCQRHWSDTKYVNEIKRQQDPTHCPTCQTPYILELQFNEEKWIDYLYKLMNSTCDTYGEHEWPENPRDWSPWMFNFDIPQNQMIIVAENAEIILTQVLFELHPELRDQLGDECETPSTNGDDWRNTDYHNLMDEGCIFQDTHYSKPIISSNIKQTIIYDYPNGSQATLVNGLYTYTKYNTGDQLWFKFEDDKYKVIKIHTCYGDIIEEHQFNTNPFGD